MLRFQIDGENIQQLEIIEFEKRYFGKGSRD
jgi:hypothetical protein